MKVAVAISILLNVLVLALAGAALWSDQFSARVAEKVGWATSQQLDDKADAEPSPDQSRGEVTAELKTEAICRAMEYYSDTGELNQDPYNLDTETARYVGHVRKLVDRVAHGCKVGPTSMTLP